MEQEIDGRTDMVVEKLNQIGCFLGTINKLIPKDAKGKSKACYYLEFKDDHGRVTSMRFNKPFNDYDFNEATKIIELFRPGITKNVCKQKGEAATLKELISHKDKPIVFSNTVFEYLGKPFFSVDKVLDVKYSVYLVEGGENGNDNSGSFDDFGSTGFGE